MLPRSPPTSRRKKTRYLSLRRRLAAAASASTPMESRAPPSPSIIASDDHPVQLDLFPLHPSTTALDDDDDPHVGEHLSRFFPSNDAAVSLHSLLCPNPSPSSSSALVTSEDQLSPSSSSANYSACSSWSVGAAVVVGLARAALRGRERWWAEEEEEEGEAASGGAAGLLSHSTPRLSLKLDYDAVLNDWSGSRPLFVGGVDGAALRVVPDHLLGCHAAVPVTYTTTVFVDVGGCHGELAAAEGDQCGSRGGQEEGGKAEEGEEEEDGDDDEKAAAGREVDREARVMRYKEKRRHRLFSKRIRYEVRKLNAEKRPRLKGRFVKRDGDL